MNLKPIPGNVVVHTPTEAEAKELLAILHDNGYKWFDGSNLTDTLWGVCKDETCYQMGLNMVTYADVEGFDGTAIILTLAEFKERYCEMTEPLTEKAEETSVIQQKPQPKFKVNDIVKVVGYQTDCIASMGTHVGEVGLSFGRWRTMRITSKSPVITGFTRGIRIGWNPTPNPKQKKKQWKQKS